MPAIHRDLTEQEAMRRALELAATPGVPLGPNPRVGCVILRSDGSLVADGYHRGAGSPHAEAAALAKAGESARGATAVVSLEPCNHQGRTPPCAPALIQAGITRVVFAMRDPNPVAQGGARALDAAGVAIEHGMMEAEARRLNRAWLFGLEHGRPLVTWKFAATLDGRSAAADGSSRWITNRAARRDVHRLRAECDVVLVGTETVMQDDPHLTVRDEHDRPASYQPLRAVMGERELDQQRRVFDRAAETMQLHTHEPKVALRELFERGRRHVLLEGGATVAAAFLRAGVVDEIVAYVAPIVLGAGQPAVTDFGVESLAKALHSHDTHMDVMPGDEGEPPNMRVSLRLR
ncbi:MAG TPA: bifunctional diaminohydroxyphosphoribosylaminopyrimidine deaminase/5-amino-6-(5-phosphoribosylamino)uracil reductase RibD [Gemmatimonadaceae bacterium]|nr:bifunctional diaminohydroxyphosphoribosylaminopyrimidine deaminase/5-amino-6-(5-phosphoribosylamino)uracil reductase RibD [Gemmatimonadaceae bacterium]